VRKSNKKTIWIIIGIVFMISLASEFGAMAKQTGLAEALLSMAVLILIVIGIIFWIRKSRGGKDRIRKL
jgi:hypothetical protein